MTSSELIGCVAALYLRDQLLPDATTPGGADDDNSQGTARFLIDSLSADQTAWVARAVLADAELAPLFDIKLPESYMTGQGLPPEILTDKPAVSHRNNSDKPALLLANVGDGQAQSLTMLALVGAPQLAARPDLWIKVAAQGIVLDDLGKRAWEKALAGLQELELRSLERLADYLLRVRKALDVEGLPIFNALGDALPALQMPRDTTYFEAIGERYVNHVSKWRNYYSAADKKRANFLHKRTVNQTLLNASDLQTTFDKVKDSEIPQAIHSIIEAFIAAPRGWNDEAAALCECEWADVRALFDGLKKEKVNLGKATINFFDEGEAELLTPSDHDYLKRLAARRAPQVEEEDRKFYEEKRITLSQDAKLKSQWDRFVFGSPLETDDFVLGLALCMESLFNQIPPSKKRRLKIRCDHRTKKQLKNLNVDAGEFFVMRYKGLPALLGAGVSWDMGYFWSFPQLVEEWRTGKLPQNHSTSRTALQIKFILELEADLVSGDKESYTAQLLWKFELNTVQCQFASDWKRLVAQPLVYCSADRRPISGKGQFQSVDLSDVKTLEPSPGKPRGSFIGPQKPATNLGVDWAKNLKESLAKGFIPDTVAADLNSKWNLFRECYSEAVKGFIEKGVASDELLEQATVYASLLDTLCRDAKGDMNREKLLRPLMRIGAVSINGGRPIAVITPWHPLRMAAMAVKARRVTGLIKKLLSAQSVEFGDSRLFFRDVKDVLSHPFYPEIVLGWEGDKGVLLSLSDTTGDYSLHESPRAEDALDDTNENPTSAAKTVAELVQRYLSLHPHESANLSVVLYNCDSARLPQAVVDKIGTMHEDDEDVRCQVMLRHNHPNRLRALYERIVETSNTDTDAFNASEATRDFMARLRIGISADQAPTPNPKEGPPHDIVFSQDVIARHAAVDWYQEIARPVPIQELAPSGWARRRPAAKADLKSVVYLCCPAQSAEGWSYLTALATFIKGDWDENEDLRWVPARELDFKDPGMKRIFEETHNLGNWVVNYDEMLDRRQLIDQQVRVIRYKQSNTQGRSLIISSTAPTGLLDSMLLSRLHDLNLGLSDEEMRKLTQRFKEDAGDISGDIVLRAAKRGRSASELMGIVLSRFLIRQELGENRLYGWYFLDDYAVWLGQREQTIADILALSPEKTPEGRLRLAVVVAEAKYVEASGLSTHRKKSQQQLHDTVKRIEDAIFGSPERLDRELWLARISDLIMDGVQFPANASVNLNDWRYALRNGNCDIYIRGYSHVFLSSPSKTSEVSEFVDVAGLKGCYQEIFSQEQVRELVLRYFRGQDPLSVRQEVPVPTDWPTPNYRRPLVPRATSPNTPASTAKGESNQSSNTTTQPTSGSEPQPPTLNGAQNGASAIAETAAIEPAPTQSEMPINGSIAPETSDGIVAVVVKTVPVVEDVTLTSAATAGPIKTPENGNKEQEKRMWAYPEIASLLKTEADSPSQTAEAEAWLKTTENATRGALQQFQLQSKLISAKLTPNAALLKFQGSANLTIDQVARRRSEFLTTHRLNIVSIQPEPGVVSLAVERPQRQIVRLEELWSRWNPSSEDGNQKLLIGVREDDGELLFLSPGKEHAPHTLIAGSTGSGKSVLVQNILLGVAATNTPAQARIILIDPKQGVDYFAFESLPHLRDGIIDDQDKALVKLNELVEEMDERYRKFRSAKAANLSIYNSKVALEERMPFIWLIHDEFAEWMQVERYKEEVSSLVGRLGTKARAAGIYLVFAAQRPDQNVMPMQLRANLGNRLILRVDSEGTSEIALTEKGAERLLGKGHLLAKLEGEPRSLYAQVPLIDSAVLDAIIEIVSAEAGVAP